jgi:hypothetical protein
MVWGVTACGGNETHRAVRTNDESTTSSTPTDISAFAGTWVRHGISVSVSRSGHLEGSYRTYRTCGEDPPPCDRVEGNNIIDGGTITGQLVRFTARSAKVTHLVDTGDTIVDDPAIFELLDDGKARLQDTIMCGDETTFTMECGA